MQKKLMVGHDTQMLLGVLRQISQQLSELERRLDDLEHKMETRQPKLLDLMDDMFESDESETQSESESEGGYESAPASFQY